MKLSTAILSGLPRYFGDAGLNGRLPETGRNANEQPGIASGQETEQTYTRGPFDKTTDLSISIGKITRITLATWLFVLP